MVTENSSGTERLVQLATDLQRHQDLVGVLDYAAVEAAVERIAALLIEALGAQAARTRYVYPLARGGLVVAGLLAYALDLDRSQLAPAPMGDRAVLVVDDIGFSGKRVAEALDVLQSTDVVVVHVASHPGMREAIAMDERVRLCVAAIDLVSRSTDTRHTDSAPPDDSRFWTGRSNIVAFPWTEPDVRLWNPDLATFEAGWRVVSPELCLENRMILGPPSPHRADRTFRFPESLAFGWFDGSLLVCRLDEEQVMGLDEVAARLWGAVATLGTIERAARHVATQIDASLERLLEDLNSLVPALIEAGLLERTEP